VTTHDALGAYARRYGLRVIATVIPSRSTRGQASAGETADLVRLIRREHVPAVFAESSVRATSSRRSRTRPARRSRRRCTPIPLGREGSRGATYVGSMEANTRTIVGALGGDEGRCP
jgi:ABC-type Zn uptake system ZnuABC Zn-binding protein ZnuA